MRRSTTTLVLLFGLATFSVQAQEEDVFAVPPRATGSGASAHQPGPVRTWNSTNREEMARDYIRQRAQEKAEARRPASNAPEFDETYAFGGLPTGRENYTANEVSLAMEEMTAGIEEAAKKLKSGEGWTSRNPAADARSTE